MISIIIPILKKDIQHISVLDTLKEQAGHFELIVVQQADSGYVLPEAYLGKVVSASGHTRGELLNAAVAEAEGQVLLFLWPDSQLPSAAVTAIEHNLQLLPMSVGGNFHLKFDDPSFYSKVVTDFLKKCRYRGYYYGNSGIFIRRDAFIDLHGFKAYDILEDYDFARRMEKYGPTLYLPQAIKVSMPKHRKLKATLIWPLIQILFFLRVSPQRLAGFWKHA